MKIVIPRQQGDEPRAPITPDAVKKLCALGATVAVEPGVGLGAHLADQSYVDAGATLISSGEDAWGEATGADVIVTLAPPTPTQAGALGKGTVLVGMLSPLSQPDLVRVLVERQVTAISLEFLPRITRAQAMDVLSSQANMAGYKAVLLGANYCAKMFPMMITAAGTLAPAKCFVIGAGVAGLQAIATAKRLGAIVEAFDVRAATKEQVQSLGARFIELPTSKQDDAATGGYARELTDAERQQQTDLMAKHVISADVVVTTAALFGKAPPMLIPAGVVAQMSPGAVLVDIAASPEHGRGNCELTRPGEVYTTERGVTLVGTLNLPGAVPIHASQAYANNILSLLNALITQESQGEAKAPVLRINLEDEIQKGAVIIHAGHIVNELVRQSIEGA